ncbi:pyrroline-5-carboxylate reductase [Salipaludibacillus daqingensis]|uniref:pyrroline-5-carboxylate reductase n=1 Tax=Salipaludibacillus daqingensis TaxID=3041001 RepID=UPI0024771A94|nr:pyrroline-5-carboxylate reductase [Salipaludibacillus daqingensis]
MSKTNILFIGAGRMAEAILSGLVSKKNDFEKITVTNENNKAKLERLRSSYHVNVSGNWSMELDRHDVIVLATPPDTHDMLLRELSTKIKNQFIITVAAGIDPSYMETRLPKGAAVAWIMPNTGAQVGASMSTFACGKYVEQKHRDVLAKVLSSIGESEELSEEKVHDMTAITGSAPAFLYSFADALEQAAMSYDIEPEQARKLVTYMLKGSVAMLETGASPKELMEQVASPGGSTAEGLRVLEEADLLAIMKNAVKATNDHARSNN